MLKMATKRNDPNYAQVTGHIPKDLSIQFRMACTTKGLNLSEGLEASIVQWLAGSDSTEVESGNQTSADHADATEDLEQMGEFIKLLLGLRPRNGLSFAEIADIAGLSSRQVEELYQLVEICRKQNELRK